MLVRLYTTLGCHLCEDALVLLREYELASAIALELDQIEISDSDVLMQKYGIRIPVVQIAANEAELGWPFNLLELAKFLDHNSLL